MSSPVTTACRCRRVGRRRLRRRAPRAGAGARPVEQAILLAVVHLALGAGQDGVVVGEHRAACLGAEELPVDPAEAGHQPVRRRVGHQVVEAAPGPLRRDDQAAVLLEAPRVAQVLDVLAGGAAAAGVAPLRRRRPARVGRRRHPGQELGQLRAHAVGRLGPRQLLVGLGRPRRFGHGGQDVAGLHGRAGRHRHRVDAARCGRHHHVLHLHGFEDHDRGPGSHAVPRCHLDRHHGPGEGCHERHRDLPSGRSRTGDS